MLAGFAGSGKLLLRLECPPNMTYSTTYAFPVRGRSGMMTEVPVELVAAHQLLLGSGGSVYICGHGEASKPAHRRSRVPSQLTRLCHGSSAGVAVALIRSPASAGWWGSATTRRRRRSCTAAACTSRLAPRGTAAEAGRGSGTGCPCVACAQRDGVSPQSLRTCPAQPATVGTSPPHQPML